MQSVMPGVKLTYDDLLKMPEDNLRHELIDGVHYVTASPNTRHQRVLGRLYLTIANWLSEHPLGELFFAPVDVVLSPHDVVVPDLLYLSHARASDVLTPAAVRGMPELIVEVLSPGTRRRDRTIKQTLYAREGASEYWLVDPDRDTIRVYRRTGAELELLPELSADADDVLTTPLLPGLDVPLVSIFER
jgi:Uma2 family endonuclease